MAKNEQQRQKKLAKKQSKNLRARRELARTKQQQASLAGQMQRAAEGEVYGSYISSSLGSGMGTVMLARHAPGGRLAFAFILLDTYCLGVKDAGGRVCAAKEFEEILDRFRSNEGMLPAEPSSVRKLVERAIEYADSLGFSPHPDYRKVSPIWGDIDPTESNRKFEFGRNGRPCYIAGPNDDPQRQTLIVHRLRQTVGEGNFDCTLTIDPMAEYWMDEQPEGEGSGISRIGRLDES